jgi:superfamily II DNA/RNA helicase
MTPDVAQGKFGSWLLNYLAKIASAQRHLRPTLFVFEEAHIYCETTDVPGPIAKVLTVLGEARRDPGGKFILNVVSATLDAATYRLFSDSIPAEKERGSGALRQAVVGNVDLTRSKLDVSIRRCETKTEAERTLKEEVGHRSWSKCIVIVPFVADVDEVAGTLSTLSTQRGFKVYSGTSEKPEGLQEFMVSDRTERSLLVATNVASCGVSVKGVNLSIIYGGQYALSQVVQTMGRAARSDDLPGRAVWIYREAVQDK